MKRILLSIFTITAFGFVNAQSYVDADGFFENFDSTDKTEDPCSDREIFWYGCGVTTDATNPECNSAEYALTRAGDDKLVVATTKPDVAGNWSPLGFSLVNADKDQTVDISSTGEVSAKYINTSSSTVEVYWLFTSSSDAGTTFNVSNADGTGLPWGGVVAAGDTKVLTFDLTSGTRTSWGLDEAGCAAKGGSGGGTEKCIWNDGLDVANLYSVDIIVTGEATASSGWAPAALAGETVVFEYIKGGFGFPCTWSIEEGSVKGLNIFPNPSSDLLNVTFESTSTTIVEMIDLTGKVVSISTAEAGTVNKQFSTTNINAGIYFVNVKNENGSTTSKVVVK